MGSFPALDCLQIRVNDCIYDKAGSIFKGIANVPRIEWINGEALLLVGASGGMTHPCQHLNSPHSWSDRAIVLEDCSKVNLNGGQKTMALCRSKIVRQRSAGFQYLRTDSFFQV